MKFLRTGFYSVYPYLSAQDKSKFLTTASSLFEAFNSFAILHQDELPDIWKDVLDNQLALKGMILESSRQLRENILKSKDTTQINQFNKWLDQKQKLANLYALDQSALDSRKY